MDWGVFLFLFHFLEENVNNCGNVSIVGGGEDDDGGVATHNRFHRES